MMTVICSLNSYYMIYPHDCFRQYRMSPRAAVGFVCTLAIVICTTTVVHGQMTERPTRFMEEDDLICKSVALLYMSRVIRKTTFCICENKDADQLHGNRKADQRHCFRYIDRTIPLLSTSEISSL